MQGALAMLCLDNRDERRFIFDIQTTDVSTNYGHADIR